MLMRVPQERPMAYSLRYNPPPMVVRQTNLVVDPNADTPAGRYVRANGLPGTKIANAIPPMDSPRYAELQRTFGLRPDEYLTQLRLKE